MSEWKETTLGELAILNYGKSLPERKRVHGNIPVYSSAGVTGWHDKALVNSKGLIIGRKGTIGKVYKSKTPFFPIDTCYYILPNEERYDLTFLYYLLTELRLDELNEDSAVPGLNRETAYSQTILLPPPPRTTRHSRSPFQLRRQNRPAAPPKPNPRANGRNPLSAVVCGES